MNVHNDVRYLYSCILPYNVLHINTACSLLVYVRISVLTNYCLSREVAPNVWDTLVHTYILLIKLGLGKIN